MRLRPRLCVGATAGKEKIFRSTVWGFSMVTILNGRQKSAILYEKWACSSVVEQLPFKQRVVSSILTRPSKKTSDINLAIFCKLNLVA